MHLCPASGVQLGWNGGLTDPLGLCVPAGMNAHGSKTPNCTVLPSGPDFGVGGTGWDEFDLLSVAFAPTALGVIIPTNAEGGLNLNDPSFGTVVLAGGADIEL